MAHQSKIGFRFVRLVLGAIIVAATGGSPSAVAEDVVASAPQGTAVVEVDLDALPPLPDGEGLAGAIAGLTD